MTLHCITTFSKSVIIISRTEYLFLSEQSAMCVRTRAGLLSPNRFSELVQGSMIEKAGASSDII
jgi:hypothetical protein